MPCHIHVRVHVGVRWFPIVRGPDAVEVSRPRWRPKPWGWLCKRWSHPPSRWEVNMSAPPHRAETRTNTHTQELTWWYCSTRYWHNSILILILLYLIFSIVQRTVIDSLKVAKGWKKLNQILNRKKLNKKWLLYCFHSTSSLLCVLLLLK